MATKKVSKPAKKKSSSKKIWILAMADDKITTFSELATKTWGNDVSIHTTKEDALDEFDSEIDQYILEVTINKIETDIVDKKTNLKEVTLK